jgi:superfamily II DNA or RNA helicase
LSELQALLRRVGIALVVQDERQGGDPLDVAFDGSLTGAQEEAAQELLRHEMGVLVAPPGSGKTVIGSTRRRN